MIFKPKEYSVQKVAVRGWDPQKKQKTWLPANFRISLGGIDQRTANSTTARSTVQDFEKNTEKVGGCFGLTSESGGSLPQAQGDAVAIGLLKARHDSVKNSIHNIR